ncbi:hypothetical protein D3C76_222030 [compost metagenome]
MDNDLLSKSKLIDWLEEKIESYFLAYHNSHSDYDQGREDSYHEVIESVRSGLFDPDTTPSPTIKPGEEAIHKDIGNVKILWLGVNMATVSKDGLYYDVYLKDLEVIESD